MKLAGAILSVMAFFTTASFLRAQSPQSFRVLLGVTDESQTRWDGTVAAKQAGKLTLEAWRPDFDEQLGVDKIEGSSFRISTHTPRLNDIPEAPSGVVANGFIINASAVTKDTEFAITTARGDFSFRAADIPYGAGVYKLADRVYVDRVPNAVRLTDTPDEEDYPSAAAGQNGVIWLAYEQFHHSPDYVKLRESLSQAPKTFSQYREPTGGDQIWVRRYSEGSWGEPIPLTKPGGDFYRTAIAVDGSGRAWVFWSENRGGNFDIFARVISSSGPREQLRISNEAGSDIEPVAVTDATGRVWVAWQSWRNGVAGIYAAHQEGTRFSPPSEISGSSKNEWHPAIAADRTGRVAVAWDSYRNGNSDVYARIWESDSWSKEIVIAATPRYEAYPSVAFDPTGRLWIAYEEGGQRWGKDYGSYKSTGVSVYLGRLVKLRGLDPDGRLVALDASLDSALVGIPSLRADRLGSQSESASLDPDPNLAPHRPPDWSPDWGHLLSRTAKNSLPRLAVDGRSRIWLAFRSKHPIWWGPLGPVWTEYVVSFDGKGWSKPIFLNHSDNLLDNRPALVALANGKLLIVNSSDGRRDLKPSEESLEKFGLTLRPGVDPYENDLWSDEVDLGPGSGDIPVVPEPSDVNPARPTFDPAEVAGIQAIRTYRGGPNGDLRIVRGEFHRHSEISEDGDFDGAILDQWRYVLDAADLDWVGCCDHDNGSGREYSWWTEQKLTDVFYSPGKFVSMFSYERSVDYPEGHRNVIFAQRGIRPLPRLPRSSEDHFGPAPDTQMLYAYLKQFNGIVASHTSATQMGTDWRNNDPAVEPLVEIFQGLRQSYEMPGGPRATSEKDAIIGWRPEGYVINALNKGYRLGFEASSDHFSTHISYSNVYVKDLTRGSLLEAIHERHAYASTDNILADVESGTHLMGDEFSTSQLPVLKVKLTGTSKFANVVIVKDGKMAYSTSPNAQEVEFSWRDNQPNNNKTSYYYVRGEQDNGEIVWVSPLWIRYTGN
jgi:hypothetical protein